MILLQENWPYYYEGRELLDEVQTGPLQLFLTTINEKVEIENDRNSRLEAIKESIKNKDEARLMTNLCNPSARLPQITNARADIYLNELDSYEEEITSDILENNLCGISTLVRVNEMLDHGNDR